MLMNSDNFISLLFLFFFIFLSEPWKSTNELQRKLHYRGKTQLPRSRIKLLCHCVEPLFHCTRAPIFSILIDYFALFYSFL